MNPQPASESKSGEVLVIAKGAGIVFLGTALGTVLKYGFELLIARKLGAESFGLFFLGFSFFKISEIIITLGLHNGILRYGALYRGNEDQGRAKGAVITAIRITFISSVLFVTIWIFGSKFLAPLVSQNPEMPELLRLFSLALPFSVLSLIMVYSIQSFKIMAPRIWIKEIFEPGARILIFIIFILLGWQLKGALFAILLSSILGLGLALTWLRRTFPLIKDRSVEAIFETRKILQFSWPLFFTGFLNITFLWIGTLISGYFLPEDEVGYFAAAQRTAILGILVLNSFNAIFAPIIADLANRKELAKLTELFKLVYKWIISLSLPIFILMILLSGNILNLFGNDFIQARTCLIILAVGQLINVGAGPYGYMIMMSGRSKINLVNALAVTTLNIALCLYLIPRYGINGAAWAASIALSMISVIGLIEVYVIYRIHPFRYDLWKPLLSGALATTATLAAARLFFASSANLISLVGQGIVFAVIFGGALFLLGVTEEDRFVAQTILAKLVR